MGNTTKTNWNDKRLRRLFDRYDRLYFRGRLSGYRVQIGTLGYFGLCDDRKRIITIDVARHKTDRELRGTVLHEMCHAVARAPWHSVEFFAQVECLLRKGAPITVSDAEAGKVSSLANVVPARFPLLKARMDRVHARRDKRFEQFAKEHDVQTVHITPDHILKEFDDFETGASLPWLAARRFVGKEYGLTDESGRPLTAFARNLIAKGRTVHTRARREYLDYQKQHLAFEKMIAAGQVHSGTETDGRT